MNYGFETRCIHGNGTDEKTHSYGSVAVPIYQAATFAHPGIGQSTGYDYTRESNPTRTELEHTMSALEGAVDTVACANGMAAVGLCLELFDRGDHILCTDDLYGGSVRMFESVGGKRGLEFSYVDTADADLVEAGIRENTKALYIETPSNPTMRVTDLRKMKEIADKHNLKIMFICDFFHHYFKDRLNWERIWLSTAGQNSLVDIMTHWQDSCVRRMKRQRRRSVIYIRQSEAVLHHLTAI